MRTQHIHCALADSPCCACCGARTDHEDPYAACGLNIGAGGGKGMYCLHMHNTHTTTSTHACTPHHMHTARTCTHTQHPPTHKIHARTSMHAPLRHAQRIRRWRKGACCTQPLHPHSQHTRMRSTHTRTRTQHPHRHTIHARTALHALIKSLLFACKCAQASRLGSRVQSWCSLQRMAPVSDVRLFLSINVAVCTTMLDPMPTATQHNNSTH